MSNIGIFCPPLPGHLHPAAVLGRMLKQKGHRVTVFQFLQFRPQVEKEELEFCGLGPDVSLTERVREMGGAEHQQSLKLAVEGARQSAENICVHGPAAIQERAIDLILTDQNEPGGGTVAQHLGIPFLNICPSLPLNREPAIPPPFAGWAYSRSPLALLRNAVGLKIADFLVAPINRTLNRYRKQWNLAPVTQPDDSFSPLAQLSQMTREFDFPRERLAKTFRYFGPWIESTARQQTSFPFERLDGRPIVYASYGTLQPEAGKQFVLIAEACARLNLQLVLAAGASASSLPPLAANALAVPYAPQLELLPRATLVITHGGMNTVMQTLCFGKPMLAIPQTHDQPAIAARIAHAGCGIVLQPKRVSAETVESGLRRLLQEPTFQERALSQKQAIEKSGGAERAVQLIETFLG